MKRKFNYSYIIVALCFLVICTTLGLCSSGRTMYLTAITDALNIKRSAFSLSETFRFITTTVLNVFFGTLVTKFGTKKLMCAGFVCLIAFALINSYAESLYVFYIAGVLLGIGLAWTGTTMMSVVVNMWCKENKGAITGAILAANGLGGAVAVQILSPIIFEDGNPFGYRNSYRLVALVLAIMLVLVIVLFKEIPSKEKSEISPVKKRKARGAGWVGIEYAQALKKPYFYLTLVCMLLTGISLQGLAGISTPHMYDIGMDKGFVATIMTISSLCLMGSKFIIGFLYDNTGIKISMNICFISSFVSLIGIVLLSNTLVGQVIAVVRVLFYALAMPLETVMIPLFASELFGNKDFSKITGIFSACTTAGCALGAPFANLCYDIFGNYNVAFIAFAALMLFVTLTMQFVVKLAHRDRRIVELTANG